MVVGHAVCGTAGNQRDGIHLRRSSCLVHAQILRDTVCRTVRLWPVGRSTGSIGAGECGLYYSEQYGDHPVSGPTELNEDQ